MHGVESITTIIPFTAYEEFFLSHVAVSPSLAQLSTRAFRMVEIPTDSTAAHVTLICKKGTNGFLIRFSELLPMYHTLLHYTHTPMAEITSD